MVRTALQVSGLHNKGADLDLTLMARHLTRTRAVSRRCNM
jgi:hypothetical protein